MKCPRLGLNGNYSKNKPGKGKKSNLHIRKGVQFTGHGKQPR